MSDLVERLNTIARGDHARGCGGRTYSCECGYDEQAWATADQAAARITKLEAENARLREALGPLAFIDMGKDEDEAAAFTTQDVWAIIHRDRVQDWFSFEELDEARAALAQGEG
jgi:hypothetical protein